LKFLGSAHEERRLAMSKRRKCLALFAAFVGLFGSGALASSGGGELDAEGGLVQEHQPSSMATTSSEYKLPAAVDPDVLGDRATELWARVYRPAHLHGSHPLVIFLHGNHATCGTGENPRQDLNATYTTTGTCPPGFVVVPSHAGYEYVATDLASRGYIVVSINANRGINVGDGVPDDPGLILARGRLILKHLMMLSRWNNGIDPTPDSLGFSLEGQLDFRNVGLMGHSRGGEGARAAYAQYRDPGSPWPSMIPDRVRFQGIFEIGPVDGQSSRVLDANDTPWVVLLPMCDGDVSNLQGIRPFDRMLATLEEQPPSLKATFTVWGANHNYYNTEWQVSEWVESGFEEFPCTNHTPIFSSGPGVTGSPAQQETGRIAMSAFFRANVGRFERRRLNRLFDPLFDLPSALSDITRVDRGFTPSPDQDLTLRLEDFVKPTGTSTFGFPNDTSSISIAHDIVPEHDASLTGARISWIGSGTDVFFQTNFAPAGSGISLRRFDMLELRVDRAFDSLNPAEPTDFSIQLVNADGTMSKPVSIAEFLDLSGPVGSPFDLHSMLQTARIPLRLFTHAQLGALRGVRLTFDATPSGAIYVANIRASRGVHGRALARPAHFTLRHHAPRSRPRSVGTANFIVSIDVAPAAGSLRAAGVEIELRSDVPFTPRGELLVLRIGAAEFLLSRYPDPSDLGRIVFTLSAEEFAALRAGDPVSVGYGRGPSPVEWQFGSLQKTP